MKLEVPVAEYHELLHIYSALTTDPAPAVDRLGPVAGRTEQEGDVYPKCDLACETLFDFATHQLRRAAAALHSARDHGDLDLRACEKSFAQAYEVTVRIEHELQARYDRNNDVSS